MNEMDLLVDLHINAKRQGPGSTEHTLEALKFTQLENADQLNIADIGCGTGASSLLLASKLNGHVHAIDLFPQFLGKLEQQAKALNLSAKITTHECSMDELSFDDEYFDLIWSEGAIYNIGFETGISYMKRFLKPGGCLAVSEITWTTTRRPEEIESHWLKEYPEIARGSEKIAQLESNGYSLLGYFALPSSCWIDNYYEPMEAGFQDFLNRHGNHPIAAEIVAAERKEIELYRTYQNTFSYGFYLARKDH